MVENPEDRFSRDKAHLVQRPQQAYVFQGFNITSIPLDLIGSNNLKID